MTLPSSCCNCCHSSHSDHNSHSNTNTNNSKTNNSNKDDLQRQLQIKLNVLKRCTREHQSYIEEVHLQTLRIKNLEASHNNGTNETADAHVLNKQRQVLGESQRMVPECAARAEQARREVRAFLDRHSSSPLNPDLLQEALTLLQLPS